MSGHSKWATTKHKKAVVDARRGKLFAKLIKNVEVAARNGGPDRAGNPTLYDAVQKAKRSSVPNDNIDRAIRRGGGLEAGGAEYETVTYEGYAPGGVAVLVECLTDNKNRAAAEVRTALTRNGGSMADAGSVSYLFSRKGVIIVPKAGEVTEDDVLAAVLDAGAEDVTDLGESFEVVSEATDLVDGAHGPAGRRHRLRLGRGRVPALGGGTAGRGAGQAGIPADRGHRGLRRRAGRVRQLRRFRRDHGAPGARRVSPVPPRGDAGRPGDTSDPDGPNPPAPPAGGKVEVRLLTADDDLGPELDLSVRAFGPGGEDTERALRSARATVEAGQHIGAFDGADLVASARYFDMRQWWHGRSLTMAGVAGVKVAPEERGRGVGRAMMTGLLQRIAERGYPLSVLYPATSTVYRSVGWEVAGGQYQVKVPARALRALLPPDGHAVAGRRGAVWARRPRGGRFAGPGRPTPRR